MPLHNKQTLLSSHAQKLSGDNADAVKAKVNFFIKPFGVFKNFRMLLAFLRGLSLRKFFLHFLLNKGFYFRAFTLKNSKNTKTIKQF